MEKSGTSETKPEWKRKKDGDDDEHEVYLPYLDEKTIASLELCNVVFSSKLRINQKFPREAFLASPVNGCDIVVQSVWERNRGLDGDEVYAIARPVMGGGRNTLSAVVVGIKAMHNNRVVVGTLTVPKGKSYGLLRPVDSRMPFVRIPLGNLPKERNNCLFAARIAQWTNVKYAMSFILENLGPLGTIEAETMSILLRFSVNTNPYPNHFSKYYPTADFRPSLKEINKRMDCRKICVFTIDPPTAKDLDDAVSCELQPNGSLRIGVHISDVAHFFNEGTEFDAEVAKRATTVYLVDKVYHMLPQDLCKLCSLLPGEDRLTFSVFWEFDLDHKIKSTNFRKTIINSCAQLSYIDAQKLINGDNVEMPKIFNNFTKDNIKTALLLLNNVAKRLRKDRFDRGALTIQQIKIGFHLDQESQLPVGFYREQQLETNKLIEEFMLLANMSVASHIEKCLPEIAFLRRHMPPKSEYIQRFQTLLERYGIMINPTSSKTIQDSLLKVSSDLPEEQIRSIVINHFMAKTMMRADYFCTFGVVDPNERRHYALCVDSYTHFTSPIRRYADIMVHRLLAAALNLRSVPKWSPDYVSNVAQNCNIKKHNAKLAGEASIELFFSVYVAEQGSLVVEAVVCNIGNGGIDAIVAISGTMVRILFAFIDGKVKVENDEYSHDALITWSSGRQQKINIFSRILVELTRGKGASLEVTLLPIAEPSYPATRNSSQSTN